MHLSTSRDSGTFWSLPKKLSEPGNASWPKLAVAGTMAVVVWTDHANSHSVIQASVSGDRGTTWSVPVVLSADGDRAWAPQVTAGTGGLVTAIWSSSPQSQPFTRHFWRRKNRPVVGIQSSSVGEPNGSWSAPVAVASTRDVTAQPQLATGINCAMAVWTDAGEIRASRSDIAHTSWSVASNIGTLDRREDDAPPRVVGMGSGNFTAIWITETDSEEVIRSASTKN